MMLFIFCQTCGVPVRAAETSCSRCRPTDRTGRRRVRKPVKRRERSDEQR